MQNRLPDFIGENDDSSATEISRHADLMQDPVTLSAVTSDMTKDPSGVSVRRAIFTRLHDNLVVAEFSMPSPLTPLDIYLQFFFCNTAYQQFAHYLVVSNITSLESVVHITRLQLSRHGQ